MTNFRETLRSYRGRSVAHKLCSQDLLTTDQIHWNLRTCFVYLQTFVHL